MERGERAFKEFIDLCRDVTNNDTVVLELLQKRYNGTNLHFLWSKDFPDLVDRCSQKIRDDRNNKYVYIKEFTSELKAYKAKPLKHLCDTKREAQYVDLEPPAKKPRLDDDCLSGHDKKTEDASKQDLVSQTNKSSFGEIRMPSCTLIPLSMMRENQSSASAVRPETPPACSTSSEFKNKRRISSTIKVDEVASLNLPQVKIVLDRSETPAKSDIADVSLARKSLVDSSSDTELDNDTNQKEVVDLTVLSKNNPEKIRESRRQRNIEKLEALLRKLSDEIQRLQETELSLDDLDKEDSTYTLEDRYKKRFVKVWNKLCQLKGRETTTGRETERSLNYVGTNYPEINRTISRFINKFKIFPDFTDIHEIVIRCNRKNNLGLRKTVVERLAREAFTDVGNILQKRRLADLSDNFGCHLTENLRSRDDPALFNSNLRQKLEENQKISKTKLDEVIGKYAQKQDDALSDEDTEDDDEEEEEEEEAEDNEDDEDFMKEIENVKCSSASSQNSDITDLRSDVTDVEEQDSTCRNGNKADKEVNQDDVIKDSAEEEVVCGSEEEVETPAKVSCVAIEEEIVCETEEEDESPTKGTGCLVNQEEVVSERQEEGATLGRVACSLANESAGKEHSLVYEESERLGSVDKDAVQPKTTENENKESSECVESVTAVQVDENPCTSELALVPVANVSRASEIVPCSVGHNTPVSVNSDVVICLDDDTRSPIKNYASPQKHDNSRSLVLAAAPKSAFNLQIGAKRLRTPSHSVMQKFGGAGGERSNQMEIDPKLLETGSTTLLSDDDDDDDVVEISCLRGMEHQAEYQSTEVTHSQTITTRNETQIAGNSEECCIVTTVKECITSTVVKTNETRGQSAGGKTFQVQQQTGKTMRVVGQIVRFNRFQQIQNKVAPQRNTRTSTVGMDYRTNASRVSHVQQNSTNQSSVMVNPSNQSNPVILPNKPAEVGRPDFKKNPRLVSIMVPAAQPGQRAVAVRTGHPGRGNAVQGHSAPQRHQLQRELDDISSQIVSSIFKNQPKKSTSQPDVIICDSSLPDTSSSSASTSSGNQHPGAIAIATRTSKNGAARQSTGRRRSIVKRALGNRQSSHNSSSSQGEAKISSSVLRPLRQKNFAGVGSEIIELD